jgi:hypothetical protein
MTVFLWNFDYFYWHCCGVGGYCCYCILISGVEKLVDLCSCCYGVLEKEEVLK